MVSMAARLKTAAILAGEKASASSESAGKWKSVTSEKRASGMRRLERGRWQLASAKWRGQTASRGRGLGEDQAVSGEHRVINLCLKSLACMTIRSKTPNFDIAFFDISMPPYEEKEIYSGRFKGNFRTCLM
jgi:hypothetical protein